MYVVSCRVYVRVYIHCGVMIHIFYCSCPLWMYTYIQEEMVCIYMYVHNVVFVIVFFITCAWEIWDLSEIVQKCIVFRSRTEPHLYATEGKHETWITCCVRLIYVYVHTSFRICVTHLGTCKYVYCICIQLCAPTRAYICLCMWEGNKKGCRCWKSVGKVPIGYAWPRERRRRENVDEA
jgi:hypothetical protein